MTLRSRFAPQGDGERVATEDQPTTPRTIRSSGPLPGRERFRTGVGLAIAAVLLLWRPLELTPAVSPIIWKLAGSAGALAVAYKLLTFSRWSDETRQLGKFSVIMVVAMAELAIENYFNWVAAASDERKYDAPAPLQDNVAIVTRRLAQHSDLFRLVVSWRGAHIVNMILAFLVLPFSVLWDQVPYSGFAMASRALLMHAIVRVVRTVCFCATILPNSRDPYCYQRRFPPPPSDWLEYVRVGVGTLKGMGGCNDLIISGHAVAWMLPVVTITSYYPYGPVKYFAWLAYIQTALRTTWEGWHYSVDFVLPAVLCWYVWRDLDWVCPVGKPLPVRRAARDAISKLALFVIGGALVLCGILVFCVGS